jgi:GT2 family glycosyltransferase
MADIAKLTVALATMDRPEALARGLDALLAGTMLPAEILVVDQGREPGAEAVVTQRQGAQTQLRYYPQARRGLAVSRNAAFALATCAIVAVTDDDCVADGQWVARLAQEFNSPLAPDVVTGRVLPLGPDAPGLYAVSSRTSREQMDYRGKSVPWLVGTGANFAAKSAWVERVGGYNERLGAGSPGKAGEDIDLLYRLLAAGAHVRYQPEAVIYHERQSAERRRGSRFGYGHGIGACCALWLRQRDGYALKIMAHWLWLRGRLLWQGIRRREWSALGDEGRVLWGTAHGLWYGFSTKG